MFDDPKKELKRLEEELLKHDNNDEEFERFYHDIFEEFGPGAEPSQKQAKPAAAEQKRVSTYADTPRAVAPQKKKSVKGLVILICLEVAGIVGIAAWWLMRLL